jgi:hypothetical protein
MCSHQIHYSQQWVDYIVMNSCQSDTFFVILFVIQIWDLFLSFLLSFLNSDWHLFRVFSSAVILCMNILFTVHTLFIFFFISFSVHLLILFYSFYSSCSSYSSCSFLSTSHIEQDFHFVFWLVLHWLASISVHQVQIFSFKSQSVLLWLIE